MLQISGRHKESIIWDYFDYDESMGKSICRVQISNNTVCNVKLEGQNPSNLKTHLKAKHKEVYKDFEVKDDKRKAESCKKKVVTVGKSASESVTSVTKIQTKLNKFYNEKQWTASNTNQQRLQAAVTKYFSCCMGPVSRASDPAFIDLLKEFQPKFKCPGAKKVMQ